jgi:thiol-disulfide isomerase/thioredoxin
MACARGSGGLGNDEMFRQAFADRFASLNSAFSSSPDSEVDFIAASGPACQSCQVLSSPQDMHRRGPGVPGARMAAGNSMMQWVVFFVLLVGIVAVLGYIIRKLCGVKAGAEKPLHGAAKTMPAVGGGAGGAVEVSRPEDIMPSDDALNVIFMHAKWCHYCKDMKPDFEAMAKKHAGKAKFKSVEADVLKAAKDKGNDLASKFDIKGFPMTLFLRGKQLLEKVVGKIDAGTLETKIKTHAGK